MSELASMDRAQPTWTRLYYAPLVFSRNKGRPTKWWWSSTGIKTSYIITDTQVSISLLGNGETEPRTAAAHPFEFEDSRHPFTRDEHQSICHHLCEPEGLWDDLCEDFLAMCREGTLTLVARPRSPLEKFSVIAPDVFEHFEIENWRKGVAKTADGVRMYSLHAYQPTTAQELLPRAPEPPRKRRSAPVRDRLAPIIESLYPDPDGVPTQVQLSDAQLLREVGAESDKRCDAVGKPRIPVSLDSVLRATGRRLD